MKILISILLTALLGFTAGIWLPWWSIALAAFIAAILVPQQPGRSFIGGFAGIFILWGFLAWWIDFSNKSILSQKIAQILPLGGSVTSLILSTALVGALVGGLAAATACYGRRLFFKEPTHNSVWHRSLPMGNFSRFSNGSTPKFVQLLFRIDATNSTAYPPYRFLFCFCSCGSHIRHRY